MASSSAPPLSDRQGGWEGDSAFWRSSVSGTLESLGA